MLALAVEKGRLDAARADHCARAVYQWIQTRDSLPLLLSIIAEAKSGRCSTKCIGALTADAPAAPLEICSIVRPMASRT